MWSRFTAACAISIWPARSSSICPKLDELRRVGDSSTTTGDLTVRWDTGPRRSLPLAVRLRADRSEALSRTAKPPDLTHYLLSKENSHNAWYKK
ncbi:MAG: hypothetical protein KatS3mg110_0940 [Pirellulaceae bacterium]|nr:MAG: hypothetical protein KatS3mg110_0940 [Pirellulaceae bacterium]